MKTKGFYWHIHHDKLCEWCYDYDERVNYIKTEKPENEIQTRLRLMKPVREELPKEFVEAYKKRNEADKKWVETYKKRNEARKRLYEAREKLDEAHEKFVEADEKWVEAYEKCDETDKKWNEARKKWNEADKKWDEAWKKFKPQLEALHKKECGCKEWNGTELVFK
jgi:uncharacterized coiled-coil DUF342 family protein